MLLHTNHSLVLILYFGWCIYIQQTVCQMKYNEYYYDSTPCSEIDVLDILKSSVAEVKIVQSMYMCGLACSTSQLVQGCKGAIFHGVNSTCKLIDKIEAVNSEPDFRYENKCTVVRIPICKNGGQMFNGVCDCLKEFTGRLCEEENPYFCQRRGWRLVTKQDYGMLHNSQVPIKMVLGSNVYSVKTFDLHNHTGSVDPNINHIVQANMFYAFKHGNPRKLANPYKKTFISHGVMDGTTILTKVGPTGSVDTSPAGDIVQLYIPSFLDDQRLVYSQNFGDVSNVTSALYGGFRLLRRESTRTVFMDLDNAFFTSVQSAVEWPKPLSYRSYKENMNNKTREVSEQSIEDPHHNSFSEEIAEPKIEIDKCWMKIRPAKGETQIDSALKEHIQRGQEIRVVMDGKIFTDVTNIRFTNYDVIAHVAPYIPTYFKEDGRFEVRKSVISLTGKVSDCVYNGSAPERRTSLPSLDSTEWYVSTRPWIKIYSVRESGEVLYGTKTRLNKAAFRGQNIRVCIHKTHYTYVQCTNIAAIKMSSTVDGEYVFQTTPTFGVYLRANRYFDKISSNKCEEIVYLISSDGKIEKATIVEGEDDVTYSGTYKLLMEWFAEY